MAEEDVGERPAKRLKLDGPEAEEDDQMKKEQRAGITHFVNPNTTGFSGVLKQRYTDFLVNEISLNGQVLHLTSTAVPVKKTDKKAAGQPDGPGDDPATDTTAVSTEEKGARQKARGFDSTTGAAGAEEKKDGAKQITKEEEAELEGLFGEPCVKALLKLYRDVMKNPERKPKDFHTVSTWPMDDKMKRGQAHQAIRRIFDHNLASTHADKNMIVISKASKGGRGADGSRWTRNDAGDGRGKGRLGWDELGGEYLHFSLHKENKDTMEVISFIGSQLKCAPKNFQFAGTKDRRAVTVQRVSVLRQHVYQLAGLNKVLKHGSRLGNFKYETYGLELGALWGNEFVISLRDCHFPSDDRLPLSDRLIIAKKVVSEAVGRFKQSGFLNYYGLQRFGSFTASTDDIGKSILKGDFEAAVSLILNFHPSALEAAKANDTGAKISSDDKNRALALHHWKETGNSQKAIEMMPRKFGAESAILRHLGQQRAGKKIHERDFQGALMAVQRNLRLMYVHAYQSLVWNTVVGKRWEMFGDKVVEGDLIIVGNKRVGKDEQEVDEDGEPIVRPGAEDSAATDGDFTRARPLNKEDVASGRYDIFDVVLPLPGWDVVYPPNEIGAFYKEFMGSDKGGGLDPYDMRRKWKDYSLSGGYRKLLSRPEDGISWEVRAYRDETEQLVETDLQRLDKKEGRAKNGDVDYELVADTERDNKYIAVILKMQLGASQYATMALRELCKAGGLKSYKADFGGRGN